MTTDSDKEALARRADGDLDIRAKVDAWIESILPRFAEARGDSEEVHAICALVDQWADVADRYGAENAPALGVLLALVRATGTDENGEQTIELHIGPDGFTVEVLWFDEDGGDNVEYWDLGEALVAALEVRP